MTALNSGTTLRKTDRAGNVQAELTVEADGFRYKGKVYGSLSGAAVAAAKDIGLSGTSYNGNVFWGVGKPSPVQPAERRTHSQNVADAIAVANRTARTAAKPAPAARPAEACAKANAKQPHAVEAANSPDPGKSGSVVVATVVHRTRDAKDRKLGHVGIVQRRSPEKIAKNGGRKWASWARLTADGVPTGGPERFEMYDTEAEARAHAEYAASRAP